MKFFDDKSKQTTNWNRNYFYLGTLLFVILNILLFGILGSGWSEKVFDYSANYDNFKLLNFFNGLLGSIDHVNWQHVLLNMLCFVIVGIYLERKYGTLIFLFLIFYISFFSRMANMLILQHHNRFSHGFSAGNYALYAILLIDYLFSFSKQRRNKTNIILGSIVIFAIYLCMCFNGGTSGLGFEFWPYDLITNSWHWSGFLTGVLTGLFIEIMRFNFTKIKNT